MLTKDSIRKAILDRVNAIDQNCNSTYKSHNEGVIRGLIWVLTGEDPGTYITSDMCRLFTLAGIPNHLEGNMVVYAEPGDTDWPGEDS